MDFDKLMRFILDSPNSTRRLAAGESFLDVAKSYDVELPPEVVADMKQTTEVEFLRFASSRFVGLIYEAVSTLCEMQKRCKDCNGTGRNCGACARDARTLLKIAGDATLITMAGAIATQEGSMVHAERAAADAKAEGKLN